MALNASKAVVCPPAVAVTVNSLVDGRELQREVDHHRFSRLNRDRLTSRGEMLPLGEDLVCAGQHLWDLEHPIRVGQSPERRTDHQDDGAVDRFTASGEGHLAADGAGILCIRCRRQCAGRRGQPGPASWSVDIPTWLFLSSFLSRV